MFANLLDRIETSVAGTNNSNIDLATHYRILYCLAMKASISPRADAVVLRKPLDVECFRLVIVLKALNPRLSKRGGIFFHELPDIYTHQFRQDPTRSDILQRKIYG